MVINKSKEARHAEKLRELGFSAIDKEISIEVRAELPRKLSRNERRHLKKQKYRPWFTMFDEATFATDETGQSWSGPGMTDLSSCGYENRTNEGEANLKTLRNKSRAYN